MSIIYLIKVSINVTCAILAIIMNFSSYVNGHMRNGKNHSGTIKPYGVYLLYRHNFSKNAIREIDNEVTYLNFVQEKEKK